MEQELDKTTLHSRYVLRYNIKAGAAKPHLPRHYEDEEQEENWSPGWDELPEPGLPPRSAPDTVEPRRSWADYRRDEAVSGGKPTAPRPPHSRPDSRHHHYPHELKVDNPQYDQFLDGPDVVQFDRQHPDEKDPWYEIPKHNDRYSPAHSPAQAPAHAPVHSPLHNGHKAGYPHSPGVPAPPRRESMVPEPSILPEEEELDIYDRKYWTTNFHPRHYAARDYEAAMVAGDDYSEDGEPAIPTIRHHPSVWSHQATLNMSPVMARRTSLNLLHPEERAQYKNNWRERVHNSRQLPARDDSSTYQRFKHRILNKFPGQKKATSLCDFKDFSDPPKKQKFLTNEDILDAIVRQMPRKKVFKKAKKKKRPKLASDSDLSNEPIGKYWRKDPLDRVPSSLHHWHKWQERDRRRRQGPVERVKEVLGKYCRGSKLCRLTILMLLVLIIALVAYGAVLAGRRSPATSSVMAAHTTSPPATTLSGTSTAHDTTTSAMASPADTTEAQSLAPPTTGPESGSSGGGQ